MKRTIITALAVVTLSTSISAVSANAATKDGIRTITDGIRTTEDGTGIKTDNTGTTEEETITRDVQRKGHCKKQKTAEPENAIGKEKAKETALGDLGITSEDVEKVRSHVSKLEDETVIYKVGFYYEENHFSYKINALTGEIVDKSVQNAEEYTSEHPQKRLKDRSGDVTKNNTEDSTNDSTKQRKRKGTAEKSGDRENRKKAEAAAESEVS